MKINKIALELMNLKYKEFAEFLNYWKIKKNNTFFYEFCKLTGKDDWYSNYVDFLKFYFIEYDKSKN